MIYLSERFLLRFSFIGVVINSTLLLLALSMIRGTGILWPFSSFPTSFEIYGCLLIFFDGQADHFDQPGGERNGIAFLLKLFNFFPALADVQFHQRRAWCFFFPTAHTSIVAMWVLGNFCMAYWLILQICSFVVQDQWKSVNSVFQYDWLNRCTIGSAFFSDWRLSYFKYFLKNSATLIKNSG